MPPSGLRKNKGIKTQKNGSHKMFDFMTPVYILITTEKEILFLQF